MYFKWKDHEIVLNFLSVSAQDIAKYFSFMHVKITDSLIHG